MNKYGFSVPIVLIIYNRPETTKAIWHELKKVQPKSLYIIADGPKTIEDSKLTAQSRNVINPNWPCKVTRYFSKKNLGLRNRIITGLDMVFAKEQMAIILEDDCLPDPSFFRYVEELLNKYKSDDRILSITGYTDLPGTAKNSYTFSRYIESWGWATWKRAWKLFDNDMNGWPRDKKSDWLSTIFINPLSKLYWRMIFDLTYHGCNNSWAYRWMYTAFKNQGLAIVPQVNMIENIGFGDNATNTKHSSGKLKSHSMGFPLIHPLTIRQDKNYDKAYEKRLLTNPYAWLGIIKSSL